MTCGYSCHDKWVPVTRAWHILRLQMEEQPPIWRVAANILNKQSRTANKGRSSAWGLSEVLTTLHHRNWPCYEMDTIALWPELILSYNLSNGKGT